MGEVNLDRLRELANHNWAPEQWGGGVRSSQFDVRSSSTEVVALYEHLIVRYLEAVGRYLKAEL